MRYRITGPNPSPTEVYNQTTTIPTLNTTTTATATFPSATIAVAGTYTMYAIAELVGDQNVANDQITGTFSVITPAKTWDGGATTTAWFDALNWNPDGVPVASDNVDLTLGSPATIDVNGAGVCLNLTVGTNATLQLGIPGRSRSGATTPDCGDGERADWHPGRAGELQPLRAVPSPRAPGPRSFRAPRRRP